MKKLYSQANNKKGGIADEIEKLKQRREERKNKEDFKKGNGGVNENSKSSDTEFENLMKKKKLQLNLEPEKVKLFNDLSIHQVTVQKFSF